MMTVRPGWARALVRWFEGGNESDSLWTASILRKSVWVVKDDKLELGLTIKQVRNMPYDK